MSVNLNLKEIFYLKIASQMFINLMNHDRTHKGDLFLTYKNHQFSIEVKSLQTTLIKKKDNIFTATFQCDASDRRKVTLPNGDTVETTCLQVGEFDLLAVCLYQLFDDWVYVFAKNNDLERTESKKYTPEQRQYLLKGSMRITYPPITHPYYFDPFPLLDDIIIAREKSLPG